MSASIAVDVNGGATVNAMVSKEGLHSQKRTKQEKSPEPSSGGKPYLLGLSKDILLGMWPANRVVVGNRTCRRLHSVLGCFAPHVVLKRSDNTQAREEDVYTDLSRFSKLESMVLSTQGGGSAFISSLLRASQRGVICMALTHLDLSNNQLGVEGTRKLSQILQMCGSLREISLRENNIKKEA
eukprot:2315034-Rhodomonas_salina.1